MFEGINAGDVVEWFGHRLGEVEHRAGECIFVQHPAGDRLRITHPRPHLRWLLIERLT